MPTTSVTVFTDPDPFYSDANQAHLRRAIRRMERTGGTVHEFLDAEMENDAHD